ncbi:MAG: hypothetical protein ACFCUV_10830 [Rivularia sp. (in: cyanobacteria)]
MTNKNNNQQEQQDNNVQQKIENFQKLQEEFKTELSEWLQKYQQISSNLETQLNSNHTSDEELIKLKQDTKKQIESLKDKLKDIPTKLTNLRSEYEKLKKVFEQEISNLKNEYESRKKTLENSTIEVSPENKSALQIEKDRLELLQQQYEEHKTQISFLEQEYSNRQQKYADLETEIQTQIKQLQEKYTEHIEKIRQQYDESAFLEQANKKQPIPNLSLQPQILMFPELQVECPAAPFPVTPDEKDKYESVIDNSINYIGGNYKNLDKNIDMANADFERKYYQERISQIEIERESVKLWTEKKYDEAFNQAKNQLNLYYPEEPFEQIGLNYQGIEAEVKKRLEQRKKLIEEGINKLKQQKKELLEECQKKIDIFAEIAIKRCQALIDEAKQKYQQAQNENAYDNNQ